MMGTSKLHHKTYFNEFKVVPITAEASLEYSLFAYEPRNIQTEQIKIFRKLENGLTLFNGSSFGGQVHFQYVHQIPVQRWFPYREGYSIRLVNAFINELNITGNTFDPFAGSGTTLLASRTNDLDSFGIDVNPISTLVSRVENEQYSKDDLRIFEKEIESTKILRKSLREYETSFELAGKFFNQEILQSLLQFKHHIKKIENKKVRDLYFVAWLSIIENVSNVKKEGNGIKYKNRKRTPEGYINIDKETWEGQNFPLDKFVFVRSKILRKLEVILVDLKSNYGKCEKKPRIFSGSCLEFERFFDDKIELTFFSPPYCNCFDYFEIHKVELWLGDFVTDKAEFRKLRNTGFRSNTNSLNHKLITYENEYLERLVSLFDSARLWNNKIPNVIRGYFDDMHTLLSKLHRQTVNKGFVGIVVGNSAYSGVIIPTDILVAQVAKEAGFNIKSIFVTRHLTTSSQQKQELKYLRNYLRESIVVLQK